MADKKKGAEPVKKEGRKISALYQASGETVTRKNKSCPKCGPGNFLANHKDRVTCGKCGYVEMNSKEAPAEESKTEEVKTE